jgi:Mg2+-importing ATPase
MTLLPAVSTTESVTIFALEVSRERLARATPSATPMLQEGVIEGRKIFGIITKYIKMGASSNLATCSACSVPAFFALSANGPNPGLTNNLLYEFSQTAIRTDNVDDDYIAAPRRWDIDNIFKFMVFIGPVSSIFDYATYAMMLWVFQSWNNPSLFQNGWFVESLLTQTPIIHIIRTAKLPFVESRASAALMTTSTIICCVGIVLPRGPKADPLLSRSA